MGGSYIGARIRLWVMIMMSGPKCWLLLRGKEMNHCGRGRGVWICQWQGTESPACVILFISGYFDLPRNKWHLYIHILKWNQPIIHSLLCAMVYIFLNCVQLRLYLAKSLPSPFFVVESPFQTIALTHFCPSLVIFPNSSQNIYFICCHVVFTDMFILHSRG